MRTISAAALAIFTARGGNSARLRVKVKDNSGTYRDLTTYAAAILPGLNLVTSGQWGDDVDGNGQTGTFTFKREVGKISLSPLMTASALNLQLNPAGSYAPLLDLHRQVQVDAALVPDGYEPQSGDWMPVFQGYIDIVHISTGQDEISIECSDDSAIIRDAWIKFERVYGYVQSLNGYQDVTPGGLFIWEPNTVYENDDSLIPSEANQNGFVYQNEGGAPDTSLGNEPDWTMAATAGAQVTDGVGGLLQWTNIGTTYVLQTTAVETIIQQLLDDNLGAGVVNLRCDSSPGFVVRMFQQQRQGLLEAISALILLFGWDLRYRYHDDTSSWQFTLQAVNRAPSSPAFIFTDPAGSGSSGAEIYKWNSIDLDIQGIRNDLRIIYSDPTDRDVAGNPKRKIWENNDSTSIGNYGDRFMEVAEPTVSAIDTNTAAATMGTAILSDLANPKADAEVEMPFFPWVEVQDYYQWDPDGLLHDTAFSAAVQKYQHSVDSGKARTTLTVRGKPASGYGRWLNTMAYPNVVPDPHRNQSIGFDATNIQITGAVGGMRVQIGPSAAGNGKHKDAPPPQYEVHVDETPGFTPSFSTLKSVGAHQSHPLPDLVPGKDYVAKVIPFRYNAERIVRGLPSAELAFTAGQAKALHLTSDVAWGNLPLNGSFETSFDGVQPDYWDFIAGLPGPAKAWGTDAVWADDGNGVAGTGYVKLNNARSSSVNVQIQSAFIPIDDKWTELKLSFWRKFVAGTGGASTFAVGLVFYDVTKAQISSTGTGYDISTGVGSWIKGEIFAQPPASARFMTVGFALASGTTDRVAHVDQLIVTPIGDPWWAVGGGATMEDGQTAPAFGANYSNQGGSYMAAAIRKTADGLVELRGTVKRSVAAIGSANPILTLPAGWRPSSIISVPVSGNGQHANLEVDASGVVYLLSGDNATPSAKVTLDGVRFRTW